MKSKGFDAKLFIESAAVVLNKINDAVDNTSISDDGNEAPVGQMHPIESPAEDVKKVNDAVDNTSTSDNFNKTLPPPTIQSCLKFSILMIISSAGIIVLLCIVMTLFGHISLLLNQ